MRYRSSPDGTFDKQDCEFALSWAKKIMAIRELGGKCSKCGTEDFVVLTFHHPGDKDSCISTMLDLRWSKIKEELGKCVLLCLNCHREIHANGSLSQPQRWKYKLKLLELKNCNKCSKCSHDGIASLDFHHVCGKKDFQLSGSYGVQNWTSVLLELDKCIVICSNCHLHEHFESERFERLKSVIYRKVEHYVELPLPANKEEVLSSFSKGLTAREISEKTGYSKNTLYRIRNLVNPTKTL